MPFIGDIEEESKENTFFRKVLFTGPNSQLVVMSLMPSEDIGMEKHEVDQFIRVEEGSGLAILDEKEYELPEDWAVVIPAGTEHNIINKSPEKELKLYTIYSPAEHPDGIVDETKEDALAREKSE